MAKTIGMEEEVKEQFNKFKRWKQDKLGKKINDSNFVKYLIESNPDYLAYLTELRNKEWLDEWREENKEEIKESWNAFKQRKMMEELKK